MRLRRTQQPNGAHAQVFRGITDAGRTGVPLQCSPNILLIPGSSSIADLHENLAAAALTLPDDAVPEPDAIGIDGGRRHPERRRTATLLGLGVAAMGLATLSAGAWRSR